MSNPITITNNRAAGLFHAHDREGFPLPVALSLCMERGYQVDWDDFYRSAHAAGWAWPTTRRTVQEAISDAGWPQTFEDTLDQVYAEPFKHLVAKALIETVKVADTDNGPCVKIGSPDPSNKKQVCFEITYEEAEMLKRLHP